MQLQRHADGASHAAPSCRPRGARPAGTSNVYRFQSVGEELSKYSHGCYKAWEVMLSPTRKNGKHEA